jgi:hypothetical protein
MPSALTAAYLSELKRTRHAVSAHVASKWERLPDYRDERIPGFLDATLPVVRAGQQRAVALTSAYLARKLGVPPVGLNVDSLVGANVRGGVDPATVYTRPFITVRAAIFTIGIAAASAKGLARLTSTAEMDVAMSGRDALLAFSRDSASGGEITGWTRVADPGCCEFCQSINGARTGPDEPQPLHNRCGCSAEPITGDSGGSGGFGGFAGALLGSVLGEGDAATSIEQHGELGPVITAAGDNFAGPNDLGDPNYVES